MNAQERIRCNPGDDEGIELLGEMEVALIGGARVLCPIYRVDHDVYTRGLLFPNVPELARTFESDADAVFVCETLQKEWDTQRAQYGACTR